MSDGPPYAYSDLVIALQTAKSANSHAIHFLGNKGLHNWAVIHMLAADLDRLSVHAKTDGPGKL